MMENYNSLHKMWARAHTSGSPTKYVRNCVVFKELSGIEPGNTLDVGCGTGEYSIFLAENGHRIKAFDPSTLAIKKFENQIKTLDIKAEVNTLDRFDATKLFDNIISIEVMEHIEHDKAFLQKLYSLLKPKGTLVISVPASPSLYSDADRISGHYRRYAYNDLLAMLTKAGFSNIRIKRYGFPVLFIYSVFRKLFLDKLLIKYFSKPNIKPEKKTEDITKFFPFLLNIDKLDKPLWSVGYVAKCIKK